MSLALAKAQKPTKRQTRKRKKKLGVPSYEDEYTRNSEGVLVSVHGKDKGTPELNEKGQARETLLYFGGDNRGLKRSRAYVRRTTGTLQRLHERRYITADEMKAGQQFRRDFEIGQLDPRRVPDLGRIPGLAAKHDEAWHVYEARDRVADAISALGGFGSRMGRCAWWVIGADMGITEFGEQGYFGGGRSISKHDARQILCMTVEQLSLHYGITRVKTG